MVVARKDFADELHHLVSAECECFGREVTI